MANRKEHLEFPQIDLQTGWRTPPGYPSDDFQRSYRPACLNEVAKTGGRTLAARLPFGAGARTTQPFVHDYWEEVYLLSGDLVVGDETSGLTLQNYSANTYACRPPGVYHGPFRSGKGCMLLEFHYYEQSIR